MNLEDLRRDYLMGGLEQQDLAAEPVAQFEIWLQQAIELQLKDPTAMTVATVDASGQPSQRIVLLKQVNQAGFVFFTNFGSRKARDLALNPKVSLHFPWHDIERQVKVCGVASKISAVESARYFLSRPKESQLAAWASHQSHPVSTRQLLLQQVARMKEKFAHGDIPAPDFWGGFRVVPHEIEFWQGGVNRLHDRFNYTRTEQGWTIERLAP